jgi:hypothetical protein
MLCSLSNLAEKDLEQIRSLETELGHTLLAFTCHAADPAALDEGKLAKVQALESSLGISLVAVSA